MPKSKLPPSASDALRFSKRAQLGTKGAADTAALPFSKQQQVGEDHRAGPAADLQLSKTTQMGKRPGATRSAPQTITRDHPRLSDADLPFSKREQAGERRPGPAADLPFSKTKQMGQKPGESRRP